MNTLIEALVKITPQRPLAEVARECDIVFSDGVTEILSFIVTDPFKSALDFSRDKKKVCLAIFGKYFIVVQPDARWMRALRLYQSLSKEERSTRSGIRKKVKN